MVVAVVLLFYVHGKHLRSCLPNHTFPGLLSNLPVLCAHTFASNCQLPFLNQRKEKQKYVARPGIELRTSTYESGALPTALHGPAR